MARTDQLIVASQRQSEAIDITEPVQKLVADTGIGDGVCTVYVAHTTAGVFINENADPDVLHDLLTTLDRLVPWDRNYRHAEGNAAAHIKASLLGPSQSIPVRGGRLRLGRWQGIFFAEFDGPRERQVQVTVVEGK